jgi:PIN domain nuclease of toxin-antitoxin system
VKGFLLDTSAFLILGFGDRPIPRSARERLDDGPRFVSQICAVEIAIKQSIGKLDLPAPFTTAFGYAFDRMIAEFQADLLTLEMRHIEILGRLPLHHRDPFDRIIISQALAEDMTVVTRDRVFRTYDGLNTLQI